MSCFKNTFAGGIEMAEDKTLLKKDLALILKIDTKLHYDNIAEVKKVYQTLADKKMFGTSIGQRYLKKLESVIQGNDTDKCIFCGKQSIKQSVMCSNCLAKLQPPTEAITKSEAVLSTENVIREEAQPHDEVIETDLGIHAEKKDKKTSIIKIIAVLVVAIILISIGLDTVFTILMLVSLGVLIYNAVKKKPKRNAAIAFVVFFVLTGVAGMFETDSNTDDVLKYLGTPQSEVFEDYSADNFYSEYNLLTNEGKVENGKPYITMTANGNVCTVIIESGMNSSLNVAGVYIGDSVDDMCNSMKKVNAVYDTEYSISGTLETYTFKYDDYNVQVIFKIQSGMITRISCTTNDVK